jgi:uncharacterized membrane protein
MRFLKGAARITLGLALVYAGFSHLTFARQEFQAQVPTWLPLDADFVVLASGVVEIALGLALFTRGRLAAIAGLTTAAFFVAIFPGNINQYVEGIDGFGLDTDNARLVRLFFQPLLVIWALWSSSSIAYLKGLRDNPKNAMA